MRKTHEVQIHEKEKLIASLQSLVEEQEERLQEVEESGNGEYLKPQSHFAMRVLNR